MKHLWGTPTRRTFLKAAGATALFAPFVRSRGLAQPGQFPVRLVIVSRPSGYVPAPSFDEPTGWDDKWDPTGSERSFRLGSMHTALEPHKDDMVFIRGLDLRSTGRTRDPGSHEEAMRHLLTGGGGGASIDQFIANSLNATPFRQKAMGVALKSGDRPHRRADGRSVSVDDNPYSVFDDVFGDFTPSSTSGNEVRAQQASVLDFVRGQIGTLNQELCADERGKLEAHLQAIRDIEQQLDGSAQSCIPPTVGQGINVDDVYSREQVYDAQIDLAVALLACQLTPVIPFPWGGEHGLDGDPQSWIRGPNGDPLTRHHHHYAHRDLGGTQQEYEAIGVWLVNKFAEFLAKLKAVPEGDGTLLDNCIVLMTSDQRNGWAHTTTNIPFLLAGKAGGQIETGRFLDYGSRAHNDLLVSICRLMGVDVDRFGNTSSGPLDGLADV